MVVGTSSSVASFFQLPVFSLIRPVFRLKYRSKFDVGLVEAYGQGFVKIVPGKLWNIGLSGRLINIAYAIYDVIYIYIFNTQNALKYLIAL